MKISKFIEKWIPRNKELHQEFIEQYKYEMEIDLKSILNTNSEPNKHLIIVNKSDSSHHYIRKMIVGDDEISIWSNSLYGRHIIGKDCEFLVDIPSVKSELKDEEKELAELKAKLI